MIFTTDVACGAKALSQGKLVAFATETVYGLGADATNPAAVGRIFSTKGRPVGHPLIVHVASVDSAIAWCDPSEAQAEMLAVLSDSFWPGPLTIILPRSALAAPQTVGGLTTIGLRVPSHPVALELLGQFGGGIAAPSANRFGKVSPTTAQHVVDDLGSEVDVVLDGGPCEVGVESTIVSLVDDQPVLLRAGGVTRVQLAAALGMPVLAVADSQAPTVKAPGMLRSHYAPDAEVELIGASDIEARLASAACDGSNTVGVVAPFEVGHRPSWILPDDSRGYAQRLYEVLRQADSANVDILLVVPPTGGDLVEAVGDRLCKAASPRPASSR